MDIKFSFFEACEKGDIKVVKFLLEKGADIEAKGWNRYTPLIYASCGGHIEVVKFLIKEGADIEAKNTNGKTFYSCLSEENKKIIDFFLKDIEERKKMRKFIFYFPFGK